MNLSRFLPFSVLTSLILLAGGSAVPGGTDMRTPFISSSGPRNLTLDQAVEIALRRNPTVLAAEQEIERTRGQVIEVRAQALPQLTVNTSFQQEDRGLMQGASSAQTAGSTTQSTSSQTGSQTTTASTAQGAVTTPVVTTGTTRIVSPPPTSSNTSSGAAATSGTSAATAANAAQSYVQNKTWAVTFQARQLLYSGGQVGAGIRIARLTEDQTIFKLRDVIDAVISTVRQQFYTVLVNKALISVQQEQVTLLQSQLQDQQNRFEAGTVPRFNVLQAEVALANAQPALIQARNNYHIAQLQLAKTLGAETRDLPARQEPFNLIGELTIPPVYTDLAHGLQLARERRAFLKAQRQNILIDVEAITVAAAGYKPTVSANAGYTIENDRTKKSLTESVNGWFFGVTGSWAIFDGFETYGKVKEAKARLNEARVNYEDSVQQVDLEVQQSWANLQQAKETIASQQKNIEQANEAVRLARERLAAGAGTQLDVLNSTVALAQARTTELQARLSYNTALAEFERVTAANTKYNETFNDPLTHPRPLKCRNPRMAAKTAK